MSEHIDNETTHEAAHGGEAILAVLAKSTSFSTNSS